MKGELYGKVNKIDVHCNGVMYKLAVIEKRDMAHWRNNRTSDSWNVTVVGNKVLLDTCGRISVGDMVRVSGRVESNCVDQSKWFTEIIATNIENGGKNE